MNHTPGPWLLKSFDESQMVIVPDAGTKRNPLIAIVSIGYDRPDGEANGHLIKAAPDLFRAAERIVNSLEFILGSTRVPDKMRAGLQAIIEELTPAITKAKGPVKPTPPPGRLIKEGK